MGISIRFGEQSIGDRSVPYLQTAVSDFKHIRRTAEFYGQVQEKIRRWADIPCCRRGGLRLRSGSSVIKKPVSE